MGNIFGRSACIAVLVDRHDHDAAVSDALALCWTALEWLGGGFFVKMGLHACLIPNAGV
jgi:hypothetical protein